VLHTKAVPPQQQRTKPPCRPPPQPPRVAGVYALVLGVLVAVAFNVGVRAVVRDRQQRSLLLKGLCRRLLPPRLYPEGTEEPLQVGSHHAGVSGLESRHAVACHCRLFCRVCHALWSSVYAAVASAPASWAFTPGQ
jgi:hypothetical protein